MGYRHAGGPVQSEDRCGRNRSEIESYHRLGVILERGRRGQGVEADGGAAPFTDSARSLLYESFLLPPKLQLGHGQKANHYEDQHRYDGLDEGEPARIHRPINAIRAR
jgi:hypothetical protein